MQNGIDDVMAYFAYFSAAHPPPIVVEESDEEDGKYFDPQCAPSAEESFRVLEEAVRGDRCSRPVCWGQRVAL